ncbi:hypothetical protein MRX96_025956 [Rhipicephalus microplus]
MSDYYNLLEVPRNASPEDIRRAYRRLALRWHPDKNPDNKAEAEARFKEISEAYEVLSDESRRRQYDIYGHGGHDADRHADYGSSRGGNAYHSTGAFAFTFRDPEELFREFFGSSDPFRDLFRGFHGGQRGATVFTGGFPFYQQNFGSLFRSGFIIDLDDLLFGQRMPTAGMGGVSAGFGTMPTQELTSVRYVNGKRIETRTIIQDGVKTVLCFEDGQLISRTVEGPRARSVWGGGRSATSLLQRAALPSATQETCLNSRSRHCTDAGCQHSQARQQHDPRGLKAERPQDLTTALGVFLLSVVFAYLLQVCVEAPTVRLEKLLREGDTGDTIAATPVNGKPFSSNVDIIQKSTV